jgi:hypothetical protein
VFHFLLYTLTISLQLLYLRVALLFSCDTAFWNLWFAFPFKHFHFFSFSFFNGLLNTNFLKTCVVQRVFCFINVLIKQFRSYAQTFVSNHEVLVLLFIDFFLFLSQTLEDSIELPKRKNVRLSLRPVLKLFKKKV